MSKLTPKSNIFPSFDIPFPYTISNSASLNGGATLFFTIFTFALFPTTSPSCFICNISSPSSFENNISSTSALFIKSYSISFLTMGASNASSIFFSISFMLFGIICSGIFVKVIFGSSIILIRSLQLKLCSFK